MKQLVLKNQHFFDVNTPDVQINSIYTWLGKQRLHGKESRERTKFLKLIENQVDIVVKGRKDIIESFAVKDKEGKIIYLDPSKRKKDWPFLEEFNESKPNFIYKLGNSAKEVEENTKKMQEEIRKFLDEPYYFDIGPERKDIFDTVKKIVLETTEEFDKVNATMYDEWCEAFENIRKVDEDNKEIEEKDKKED